MKKRVSFILAIVLLGGVLDIGIIFFRQKIDNFLFTMEIGRHPQAFTSAQIAQIKNTLKILPQKKKSVDNLEIEAKASLSLWIGPSHTREVLYQRNIDKRLPIASLTKLMTATVLLENPQQYPMTKEIIISPEAVGQEEDIGELKIGEKIPAESLLDIMLFESSNDAAWALAEQIGVENFVKKMNQKARQLSLSNTHFVNPTGLDPKETQWNEANMDKFNYSSSEDLAKLSQYIIEHHPQIFEITTEKDHPIFRTDGSLHHLASRGNIANAFLEKIEKDSKFRLIGFKTGFTDQAKQCLLLIIQPKKNQYIINIILGADNRYEQMERLLNYLFFSYTF